MAIIEIDETTYDSQLSEKEIRIQKQFEQFGVQKLEVFNSEPKHYRQRAEFRVWHDGDDLFHIMFNQETKEKIRVEHFEPAAPIIYDLMPKLVALLQFNETLRRKLFQIDYLSTLSGEVLISLLYHKPLDDEWLTAAEELKATLSKEFKVDIIGRARKQKILLGNDYVIEKLNVAGKEITYQQVENSFTQPNAKLNQKMLLKN